VFAQMVLAAAAFAEQPNTPSRTARVPLTWAYCGFFGRNNLDETSLSCQRNTHFAVFSDQHGT